MCDTDEVKIAEKWDLISTGIFSHETTVTA